MTIDNGFPDRLLGYLRAQTGDTGLDYALQPEPMSGGFWADLFSFSLAAPPPGWSADLVARFMPDEGLAVKETIIQKAVAEAGFPTPVVRASGGTDVGLGRAFMIMDRASGSHFLSGLSGAAFTSALPLFRQVPEVLADTMVKLHALDPEPARRQLEEVAAVPVTAAGLLERLRAIAAGCGRSDLTRAADWLSAHQPPPDADVICHGDLHPFNVLSDTDGVTVLDWSAALVASRTYDIAFTSLILAELPVSVPGSLKPVVRIIGGSLSRRFVRRYEHHAGRSIASSDLKWHQGLTALRALVEVAAWDADGITQTRAGHPWLTIGPGLAGRLSTLTHAAVSARRV